MGWGGTTENYEQVALWHNWWNTVPETTRLPAWKNYKFVITPEKNWVWCMSTIKWKGTTTADSHIIQQWKPIEMLIDNAQPWEYEFVCNGMWMRQWSIVIE